MTGKKLLGYSIHHGSGEALQLHRDFAREERVLRRVVVAKPLPENLKRGGCLLIVFPGTGIIGLMWLLGTYAIVGGILLIVAGVMVRRSVRSEVAA